MSGSMLCLCLCLFASDSFRFVSLILRRSQWVRKRRNARTFMKASFISATVTASLRAEQQTGGQKRLKESEMSLKVQAIIAFNPAYELFAEILNIYEWIQQKSTVGPWSQNVARWGLFFHSGVGNSDTRQRQKRNTTVETEDETRFFWLI